MAVHAQTHAWAACVYRDVITFLHKLLNLQFIMEPGAKFAGPGDESHPRKDPSAPPSSVSFCIALGRQLSFSGELQVLA
jgi:hypothetical protein